MPTPLSSLRDLAWRLLAAEKASPAPSDPHLHEAVRVCETLRVSLTRFAGADGFTSLMRRALALARADVPSLQKVNVKPDGSMQGLEELVDHARRSESSVPEISAGDGAAVAIIAHLLGLLTTFIGESLTLRLVREAWPDASWDELSRTEASS